MGRKPTNNKKSDANLGFENKLWAAADALRGGMDAAEYKHVVLGLIFLKYISDAFEARHQFLQAAVKDSENDYYLKPDLPNRDAIVTKVLEDPDEYRSQNVFWVPPDARWDYLQRQSKQSEIGRIVDDAMDALERDNPSLKGVLPKDYARPGLDKVRLGQIIDLFSDLDFGSDYAQEIDLLGRVYEYFLSRFAAAEGKKGGQFYTPRYVVDVLVHMLAPYKGRVYDPCCGSGGMFVQSRRFVKSHTNGNGNGGKAKDDISIFGQESNYTTWRLCRMNLAIRGINGKIEHNSAGSFLRDEHPDLRADFVLANPPFNDSDWHGELLREDKRWVHGVPPVGNANFAWVQHFLWHLSPTGTTGFVLANGSMSSQQSGEGEIRKDIIEKDLVDCMVALPGQLFYTTQIPVCLWFLTKSKTAHGFRDRQGETLFIDARRMGTLVDRVHRELTEDDIAQIARTYHSWRGDKDAGEYEDVPGFCMSATQEDIRKYGHVLTPGRYVGAEEVEDDGEPFEEKMARLSATLREQQAEAAELDSLIFKNLKEISLGS